MVLQFSYQRQFYFVSQTFNSIIVTREENTSIFLLVYIKSFSLFSLNEKYGLIFKLQCYVKEGDL